jgi:hypothetical protein
MNASPQGCKHVETKAGRRRADCVGFMADRSVRDVRSKANARPRSRAVEGEAAPCRVTRSQV